MNFSSSVFLSCHAKQAISAKAALLTNSSFRSDQSMIFCQARGVFSKRFMHTWSQMSQESMSFTHFSICFSVNFSGSSIIAATIFASGIPVLHNSSASLWFFPTSFAIVRISGTDTPNLCSADIPYRVIPSSRSGLALARSFFKTSSTETMHNRSYLLPQIF